MQELIKPLHVIMLASVLMPKSSVDVGEDYTGHKYQRQGSQRGTNITAYHISYIVFTFQSHEISTFSKKLNNHGDKSNSQN